MPSTWVNAQVHLCGTGIVQSIDRTGEFVFKTVPHGTLSLEITPTGSSEKSLLYPISIQSDSVDLQVLSPAQTNNVPWRHAVEIQLNLSGLPALGADSISPIPLRIPKELLGIKPQSMAILDRNGNQIPFDVEEWNVNEQGLVWDSSFVGVWGLGESGLDTGLSRIYRDRALEPSMEQT